MSLGKKQKPVLPIPKTRLMRLFIGALLIFGGIFSFLPILGFWMLPLGMLYLAVDYKNFRRYKRILEAKFIKLYRRFKK
ncbi:MAG: hypothetical protein OCD03_03740 [Hyphomicrobiales bacterium]